MRVLLICLLLGACAHSVHEVHVSDITSGTQLKKARVITSKAEQFAIMGFVYDTAYVDKARRDLLAQCPQGQIEGITTEYSTDLGFFSWTNHVLMKGYCVKGADA